MKHNDNNNNGTKNKNKSNGVPHEDPLEKFRALHVETLNLLDAQYGLSKGAKERFMGILMDAKSVEELLRAEDTMKAWETSKSGKGPDINQSDLERIGELHELIAAAKSREELHTAQAELDAIRAKAAEAGKAVPPAAENPNPDIRPRTPAEEMLKSVEALLGQLGDMKMPSADGTTSSPLDALRSRFQGLSNVFSPKSESARRTEIFSKIVKDKDAAKVANPLERFSFLEKYAPEMALDYNLAKTFVTSSQDLNVGSAVGLVSAEQVLTGASSQKVLRNALGIGAAAVGTYLLCDAIGKAMKK
jgi:hypothetical protein